MTWSAALRGDVDRIYRNSRHLMSLINDILDLSAFEVHRLELTLEEASIAPIVGEAVDAMHTLFTSKDLYLRVQIEAGLPPVLLDSVRVRQVLINLLGNAVRFTETGGVDVRAQVVGGDIQVAVADTGIGIAAHDVPKVFESFGQVDTTAARRHEGSGLGVPISKGLIELHGGQLWLESQPGVGTTFFFTLPIQRVPAALRLPVPAVAQQPRRTLLAPADDPTLLRLARRALADYAILPADSPEHLPELLALHDAAALLVRQPASELWQHAAAPLPVISIALPEAPEGPEQRGFTAFLLKPVGREALLATVARLAPRARRILVVDDDADLVNLYSRMLSAAGRGYQPVRAFGGAQALSRLAEQPFDLVLADIMMPEIDGLALVRAIRSQPELATLPVIATSAYALPALETHGGLCLHVHAPLPEAAAQISGGLAGLVRALAVVAPEPEHPADRAVRPAS